MYVSTPVNALTKPGHVSKPLITAAYDANNLILLGARLPQIYQNFATRSTGQLSIVTYAANALGCVARLFTTMQEGGGSAMMRSYALSEYLCGLGGHRCWMCMCRHVLCERAVRWRCAAACACMLAGVAVNVVSNYPQQLKVHLPARASCMMLQVLCSTAYWLLRY